MKNICHLLDKCDYTTLVWHPTFYDPYFTAPSTRKKRNLYFRLIIEIPLNY